MGMWLALWLEHLTADEELAGSNPTPSCCMNKSTPVPTDARPGLPMLSSTVKERRYGVSDCKIGRAHV